ETTGDLSPFQIVSNIITMEVQCIQETLRQLDRKAVEAAVDALNQARKVLLVGMGATSAAASTGAYRLVLLGIDAVWLSDPYALVAQANLLSEGDVVVGIFYHGQARTICETLQIARANGATAIALTAAPNSPLAKSADICLTVVSPAPLFTVGQFSARVVGVLLMDALVAAVAWARHQGTPTQLLKTFELQREFLEYHEGSAKASRS
ncbi:MAG TPA: MurR/RpiR family transcriptional regulator, partial [Chloroflexota bacterium]|nr:MurR/RpiR family transcriptional regulator [Chloroflexota bacterium]